MPQNMPSLRIVQMSLLARDTTYSGKVSLNVSSVLQRYPFLLRSVILTAKRWTQQDGRNVGGPA